MSDLFIFLIVFCLIAAGVAISKELKKPKTRPAPDSPEANNPPPPPPQPSREFEVIPAAYSDDHPQSRIRHVSGDPNAWAADTLFVLAMCISRGKLPEFIINSYNGKGVDKSIVPELVGLCGLNIPVYCGHLGYVTEPSAASKKLVQVSKRGKFTYVFGGPVTDMAQALKQGANAANLQNSFGTLGKGWNFAADTYSGELVRSRLKPKELDENTYKMHLKPKPGPFRDLEAFLESYRDLPAVDFIIKDWMKAKNREYNQGRVGFPNPIVLSDAINWARFLGINYKDYNAIMSAVKNGLNIMRTLTPLPPSPVFYDEPPKQRAPIKRDKFSKSTVRKIPSSNPFSWSWPQTSKITRFKATPHRLDYDHTKLRVWAGKDHPDYDDVTVNGNIWMGVPDPESGGYLMYPFEQHRPGQTSKKVGYNDMQKQSGGKASYKPVKGDEIFFFFTTQTRRGDMKNGEERSNLVWVTVK